tara:strand:- start:250 stop:468 length:219 start_codon:yes stop_codon:yes gene_type:complete
MNEAYAEYEEMGGPEGLDEWDDSEAESWNAACDAMTRAENNYYENRGWEAAMAQEAHEAQMGVIPYEVARYG